MAGGVRHPAATVSEKFVCLAFQVGVSSCMTQVPCVAEWGKLLVQEGASRSFAWLDHAGTQHTAISAPDAGPIGPGCSGAGGLLWLANKPRGYYSS